MLLPNLALAVADMGGGWIGWRAAIAALGLVLGPALGLALAGATADPAQAAPWDGEWEGTLRHPDLPCSPCKVQLTVSGGRPSVRSGTAIPSFTMNADGSVSAEIAIRAAGNGVPMNCTLRGRAQTATIAASGTCGLYATYAEMDLKRVSGAPPSAGVAAVPAPPSATPPPVAPPSPAPAVSGSFGAGTRPIRLGSVTYAIEPGSTIGQVTTGSWLAACGSSGRFVPLRHQVGTQPNAKTLGEEFERVMAAAGYTPRRTPEEPADYVIVGKVTSVRMDFCVREHTRPIQSSGEGSVNVDWTVVALAGGRSVYQATTPGSFELPPGARSSEGAREVFAGTFRDALQRLAADGGFRNAVAAAGTAAVAREPVLALRGAPRHSGGITANMNRILPSIVEVRRGTGTGTGFLIDGRGYFLTNAHVVGNEATVTLRFNDGQSQTAQVLRKDTLRDMALLKVDRLGPARAGLRPLPIRPGKLTLTEKVYAIGNPLGLSQTVTDGIVSAYRQRPGDGQEYIQASVSITFGNSGGPLLDANGNVVGVSVATMGGGLNFFIPIEAALASLDLKLGG
ncbi:MAG: S1C family serine protease [Reyranellaceae bacterium]